MIDALILCLALNIYHEARNVSESDQVGTINVVLNRVASDEFADNICDVVHSPAQFSWYWDGKDDTPYEREAWQHALELANRYVWTYRIDNTDGALCYNTLNLNTTCINMQVSIEMDAHRYYRRIGQ